MTLFKKKMNDLREGEDTVQLSEISHSLAKIMKDIEKIYSKLEPQNLLEFEDAVKKNRKCRSETLAFFMEQKIIELKNRGKTTTAQKYLSTLRQFMMFKSSRDILLENITSRELKQFEEYLIKKGVVMNTVSFYMRILRAVYNKAIKEGLIISANPFVEVYTGIAKTVKRAVEEKKINLLQTAKLPPSLTLARDLFLFSFYTRGMSFVDMAYLKKSDLENGVISYKRSKTGQSIYVGVEYCMLEIIERYSSSNHSDYLLPILYQKGSFVSYETAIRTQNQRLKLISKQLNFVVPLTTYVARHTWASIARRKGIALPIISEGMGHTSEKTTRIYLKSFDRNIIDEANRKIIINQNKKR